jgi:hypothetical protein
MSIKIEEIINKIGFMKSNTIIIFIRNNKK